MTELVLPGPFNIFDGGSFTQKPEYKDISYTDLCKLYIEKYNNPDYSFTKITPFCVACEMHHISDVQYFIKLTKEENRTGRRPEHSVAVQAITWLSSYASSLFSLPTLQELLDGESLHGNGVVSRQSQPHRTRPLFAALSNGNKYIFKILVDEGASIDISMKNGANALHYAMRYEHTGHTLLRYIILLAKERGKWDKMKNQINTDHQTTPMDVAIVKDRWNTEGWVGTLHYYGCKANKYDSEGKYVGAGFGELTAKVMVTGSEEYKLGFFRQKKLWPEIEKYRAVDAAGFQMEDDNYVQCKPCGHIFAASFLHEWVMVVDEMTNTTVTYKHTCPKCVRDINTIRWLNKQESINHENIISREYDSNSNREGARQVPSWTNRRVEKDKLVLKF